jgi:hypothetical protein
MLIAEWVAAVEGSRAETQTSNPPQIAYVVLAVIALALGLVVWVFVRTSMRRSSK